VPIEMQPNIPPTKKPQSLRLFYLTTLSVGFVGVGGSGGASLPDAGN
jgi:hypothetical protein